MYILVDASVFVAVEPAAVISSFRWIIIISSSSIIVFVVIIWLSRYYCYYDQC